MIVIFRLVLSVLVCITLAACATSPTGRSQLVLFPAGQMSQMGVAAFSDLKKQGSLTKEVTTSRYVNCVAGAVTAELATSFQKDWEVVVFDDKSANAFALPGGKIGVHTGLLEVATDQNQLASVIGHEIGHVLSQHGNERMSIQFASETSQQLLGAMIENGQQKADLMAALGLGGRYLVQLPYSRTHESEADLLGLELMAKAGFNPEASVQVWRNMSDTSKGEPLEFMSTHPSNKTRIDNLSANMSGAVEIYKKAQQQGKNPRCSKK
jgi:predicted Zn-dependent protease